MNSRSRFIEWLSPIMTLHDPVSISRISRRFSPAGTQQPVVFFRPSSTFGNRIRHQPGRDLVLHPAQRDVYRFRVHFSFDKSAGLCLNLFELRQSIAFFHATAIVVNSAILSMNKNADECIKIRQTDAAVKTDRHRSAEFPCGS